MNEFACCSNQEGMDSSTDKKMYKTNNSDALKMVESQVDGVLELKNRILLLPSTAEQVRLADLPGHHVFTEKQRIRIRQLLEDKEHSLIGGSK
ncbi:hypothetical protein AVEN_196505-1 [Araneus ventricosus]|uniref:Uncharacterized protein n=1 Tax=Araneus ventricosus TaxID=182803 RepID=A0A4Y2LMU5_ARAVE|nr:hypothetical protein AVEN_196505-1 [Araneus ventricosus]